MEMPMLRALIAIGMLSLGASMGPARAEVRRPEAAAPWQVPPKKPPTIVVDPGACRWVERHRPTADVAYKPGVDVQGRPVAPADLPGSGGIALPSTIEIGITVPIAQAFGVPETALHAAEAYIGTVRLEGDRVLFNGQPLDDAGREQLVALCAEKGDVR